MKETAWTFSAAVVLALMAHPLCMADAPRRLPVADAVVVKSVEYRPGVTLKRLVAEKPRKMAAYLVQIDLTTPGIGFTATERAPNWGEPMPDSPDFPIETECETTADFMRRRREAGENVGIAVNAAAYHPFEYPGIHRYAAFWGWNVSNGVPLSKGRNPRNAAMFILRENGRAEIASSLSPSETDGIEFSFSGKGIILKDGEDFDDPLLLRGGTAGSVCPRTTFGLTADGKTLILLVVDGRQPGYSMGASIDDLRRILRSEGCSDAIDMDGGGSSSLVVFDRKSGTPRMLNRHKDGLVRKVGLNFGITF